MELIQTIRNEIERRLLEKDHGFEDGEAEFGYNSCLKDMRRFLSTLESEKPINQNDELNDEIKRFVAEYGYERGNDILLIAIVARHFAQWGTEHAKEIDYGKIH